MAAALLMTGCYQPTIDDGDIDPDALEPPAEQFGGEPSTPPVCTEADPSPLSRLYFHVRTSSLGGRFAPRNVGAIWLERADGTFVRTLKLWGHVRTKWLERFQTASGGQPAVDALSGPTLMTHEAHEVEWDMVDETGCEIDNGAYSLVMEVTDRNGVGAWNAVAFDKASTPIAQAVTDTQHFHAMHLVLE